MAARGRNFRLVTYIHIRITAVPVADFLSSSLSAMLIQHFCNSVNCNRRVAVEKVCLANNIEASFTVRICQVFSHMSFSPSDVRIAHDKASCMGYALPSSGGKRRIAQANRLPAPFGAVPAGRVMPDPCKDKTGRAKKLAAKGSF